ncbi:MAG: ABC transporter substrate-binding protein [Elusimicrobia bacterium]|nr:ABC transporter substrate-binding protein [Elusimicrobiota bacterium]
MRWRAAILAAIPLALAACAKRAPEDGKTVLRFLAGPDVGGAAKEIVSRFEAENPDIRVEMVEGPASSDTRENMYSTSFMGGESTYDVAYVDVAWVPKFAAQGWLRPLDDRFTPKMRKAFLKSDIDGSMYDGRIYRVPVQSDGGLLYYRKDLLDKAGLPAPRTWQELVADAKQLQHPPDLWGFVFQGKQYEGLVCDFLELVWGNGGELIDDKGVHVAEKPAVEALTWLVDAVRKDGISPEGVLTFQEEEARHMFQEGHAVFMRNWPYAWNLLQDKDSPVRGKVGMEPMVHGPGGVSAATLGGWGWAISAFSKHPDAAWRFIDFASSREAQKIAYMKGGIIPTRRALFDDPDIIAKSPQYRDLLKVLETARPRPPQPQWARFSDILQVHLSEALSGQKTPQQALDAAAREIAPVLKR